MQLYNTASGRKDVFEPLDPQCVTLYLCGPTVYSYAHIGNARPSVIFDVLSRLLRRKYPAVRYVRNITDIDDKINAAAAKEGVSIGVVTDRYTTAYHEDLAALGVPNPDFEPKVTDHVPHIIDMIERLIKSGHAYAAESHVLFSVGSYDEYGQLSRRDPRELLAGARVEVAPYKKNAGDFVLWKPSPPELPGWESPWGRGRPGWHIECSAMAEALLGETIDIHGGGHDLIFPHHENERAQSVCAHGGKVFARFWLHNGFLTMNSEKMSKSLGNVLLVREILRHVPGEVARLALLTGHYRQPLDWNDEALTDARRKLDRLYGALRDLEPAEQTGTGSAPESFLAALEDDLNTPAALAELFELARSLNRATDSGERATFAAQMRDAGALLGILQQSPESWFQGRISTSDPEGAGNAVSSGVLSAEAIEARLAERTMAKKAKNFAEADRIRDELKAARILIDDTPQGTRWRLDE